MKEYMKYADDYLIFKLHEYFQERTKMYQARDMISNKSVLAYLSLTASIKHLSKKIDAVFAVLTNRDYSRQEINEKLAAFDKE